MSSTPISGGHTVTTLQNQVGAAPAAAAAPAPAHLPDPATTLAASRQRFPHVGTQYLTGMHAYSDRPAALNALTNQVTAMPAQADVTPVIIGAGDKFRVALMPNAGVAGPDVAGKIQRNVLEGKAVYDRIMSGGYTQQPHKNDVTKLMWYLQALGSAKAAESSEGTAPAVYKEGGMFIEDPDGRLQGFLTSANSYSRSSSHMRDYQALGDEFSSRGVDIRNTETPNNRKTILFARMPTDEEVPQGGPKGTGNRRMLFVKMEPYGCRGLTSRGSGVPRAPGEAPSKWKGFKRFFLNAKDLFLHGTSFIQSIGQRIGLVRVDGQNNRERVPSELKNNYKAVLDFLEKSPLDGNAPVTRQLLTTLRQGNPTGDSGGIKTMLENIRAAQAHLRQNPAAGPQARHFASTLFAFEQTLTRRGDHPEMRIGNEVIVTRDETVTGVSLVKPYNGDRPLYGSRTLEPETQDIILAGCRYRLDNIDNANKIDTFRADTNRSAYNIGAAGNETTFTQDAAGAERAVRALTGNDDRVATALMSIANQSLPADIVGRMTVDSMTESGSIVSVGNEGGTYGISRLPDNNQGEAVYVASYTADAHPTSVVTTGSAGEVQLDPNASSLKCQTQVQITVHADGSMTPTFVAPPSYSYTLIPQPAQEAAR